MTNEQKPQPPSHEALLAALETIKAHLVGAPNQQAEYGLMVEKASKVDVLDEKIKALQKEKGEHVLVLLPLLHKLSGGKVTLANGHEVLAALSQEKRITKKALVAHFGKEQAEKFWKTVDAKTREYVTVKRPGEKEETEENGEETPTPPAAPAAPAT